MAPLCRCEAPESSPAGCSCLCTAPTALPASSAHPGWGALIQSHGHRDGCGACVGGGGSSRAKGACRECPGPIPWARAASSTVGVPTPSCPQHKVSPRGALTPAVTLAGAPRMRGDTGEGGSGIPQDGGHPWRRCPRAVVGHWPHNPLDRRSWCSRTLARAVPRAGRASGHGSVQDVTLGGSRPGTGGPECPCQPHQLPAPGSYCGCWKLPWAAHGSPAQALSQHHSHSWIPPAFPRPLAARQGPGTGIPQPVGPRCLFPTLFPAVTAVSPHPSWRPLGRSPWKRIQGRKPGEY